MEKTAPTHMTSREVNQNFTAAKKAAQTAPVIISEYGEDAYALLSLNDYQAMNQPSNFANENDNSKTEYLDMEMLSELQRMVKLLNNEIKESQEKIGQLYSIAYSVKNGFEKQEKLHKDTLLAINKDHLTLIDNLGSFIKTTLNETLPNCFDIMHTSIAESLQNEQNELRKTLREALTDAQPPKKKGFFN